MGLEAVKVEVEQHERLLPLLFDMEHPAEEPAVEQPRQAVGVGEIFQLVLAAHILRDEHDPRQNTLLPRQRNDIQHQIRAFIPAAILVPKHIVLVVQAAAYGFRDSSWLNLTSSPSAKTMYRSFIY